VITNNRSVRHKIPLKNRRVQRVILSALLFSGTVAEPVAATKELTARVQADITASTEKRAKMSDRFVYYTVPAMSNIKRTMTAYPEDGTLAAPVRIVAAQGEFESASVVFHPFSNASKVELKVSDLIGKSGKISASAVDVKVVKVWYQSGAAWFSYFSDADGRELVPELLLKDENLIKVDRVKEDNYLRVDYPQPKGPQYVWISNPAKIQVPFNDHVEPVSDAATLQPFSFQAGEFKQIWLTLEAPKDAKGLYAGTLSVMVDGKSGGEIPLEVRVLPFELPDPKTNYDLTREYYASIYNANTMSVYLKQNGGDLEKAKKRLYNEYVDMRKHNAVYPMLRDYVPGEDEALIAQLETYKKAGLRTDVFFGGIPAIPPHDWLTSPEVRANPIEKQPMPELLIRRIDRASELFAQVIGPTTNYCFGWDEPAMNILTAQRKPWKYLHEKGHKTYSTANEAHLSYGGYNEDFVNYGGKYSKESSAKWHAFGARITSYAAPHTGPENPDFVRRTHGIDLYQADSDGTNNYILNGFPWNDFADRAINFRSFNIVYPGIDAPIGTLAWEGFREAIDDVRYATLLKQLAHKAIATGKIDSMYSGKMALQWLALLDGKTCDLNAARLEMISYILKLSGPQTPKS